MDEGPYNTRPPGKATGFGMTRRFSQGDFHPSWGAAPPRGTRHPLLVLTLLTTLLFGAGELGGAGGALQGSAAAWGVGECDGKFLEGLRRFVLFEE